MDTISILKSAVWQSFRLFVFVTVRVDWLHSHETRKLCPDTCWEASTKIENPLGLSIAESLKKYDRTLIRSFFVIQASGAGKTHHVCTEFLVIGFECNNRCAIV